MSRADLMLFRYDERMDWNRRPTRTWWMKRHDAVNLTLLALILLFIVWTALRR